MSVNYTRQKRVVRPVYTIVVDGQEYSKTYRTYDISLISMIFGHIQNKLEYADVKIGEVKIS